MHVPTPMPESLEQKTSRLKRLGEELMVLTGAYSINLTISGGMEIQLPKDRFNAMFAG